MRREFEEIGGDSCGAVGTAEGRLAEEIVHGVAEFVHDAADVGVFEKGGFDGIVGFLEIENHRTGGGEVGAVFFLEAILDGLHVAPSSALDAFAVEEVEVEIAAESSVGYFVLFHVLLIVPYGVHHDIGMPYEIATLAGWG